MREFAAAPNGVQVQAPVHKFTLCRWEVDLRWVVDIAADTVALNFTADTGASLMVAAYILPQDRFEPDLTIYSPLVYSGSSNITTKANYLYVLSREIAYWAKLADQSAQVKWAIAATSVSSGISAASIATLVAVTIVSASCCALCLACTYKALKRISIGRAYFDRAGFDMLFSDLSARRVHPFFPPALDQIPAVPFNSSLVEVGEPVCTICLQE